MYEINIREFKKIIHICGYHHREFTDYIGKSKGYINNCIGAWDNIVPPRFVDLLIEFVSLKNFEYAYEKILKRRDYLENRKQRKLDK